MRGNSSLVWGNTKGLTSPRDRLDFNPSASQTDSGLTPRLLFSFINEDHDTHPDQDRSTSNGRERPLTVGNIKTRFRIM